MYVFHCTFWLMSLHLLYCCYGLSLSLHPPFPCPLSLSLSLCLLPPLLHSLSVSRLPCPHLSPSASFLFFSVSPLSLFLLSGLLYSILCFTVYLSSSTGFSLRWGCYFVDVAQYGIKRQCRIVFIRPWILVVVGCFIIIPTLGILPPRVLNPFLFLSKRLI